MTRRDRQLALALAALAAAMLLAAGLVVAAVWATLDPGERAAVGTVLQPRVAVAIFVILVMIGGAALVLRRLFERYVDAPAGLLDEVRILMHGAGRRELPQRGSAANRGLAQALADLLQERNQLRDDTAQRVAQASHHIEQERSRLAALMSELKQSVVVCNLEGRILLYNSNARELFRTLSGAAAPGGGAELIGLGRSIHAIFDRQLIAHALDGIRSRLQEGAHAPSNQFVTTTPAAHLLRIRMAPVLGQDGSERGEIDGFVLMIDDITRAFEEDSQRDELLHRLTEGSRASIANLQAAVELLGLPDLEPSQRERFLAVIHEEVVSLAARVQGAAADAARQSRTRWPLDDMLGAELVAAACRYIETLPGGLQAEAIDVDRSLWLRVDSFSLLQAIGYLASRLQQECQVRAVRLRLTAASPRAQLDIAWRGPVLGSATLASWQSDAMRLAGQSLPLNLNEVVDRHDGEFWFEREPAGDGGFFRFLLPVAQAPVEAPAAPPPRRGARPEFYDFDLFRNSPQSRQLDDRALADLSYTVFDTETTGLDPSGGDEIIQIGATRVVNGKLLKSECFNQLVDPQRSIAPASALIHGLTPDMLRGQPTIRAVLPAFHAFVSDTVLVAHNAAFDMRFLELKQDVAGVRFDQTVLDTLLLAAVAHPDHASHGLEEIAVRLDIEVAKRHDALADALLTAEIFLRLIPLLRNLGIRTLGEARAAALRTYYARLRY